MNSEILKTGEWEPAAFGELRPRLRAVACEIARRAVAAGGAHDIVYDIGTDHARLPVCLVRAGVCLSAAASDLREAPLAMARAAVGAAGLYGRVSLALGDGFSAFEDYRPARIVVAAGIGAVNLTEIIGRGFERARTAACLILQPMNNHELLRGYLVGHGFDIEYERLAEEDRRIYSVLMCRWTGGAADYAPEEYYTGRRLYGSADEIAHFYRFTYNKVMNRYRGLRAALNGRGGGGEGAGVDVDVGAGEDMTAAAREAERLAAVLSAIESRVRRYETVN